MSSAFLGVCVAAGGFLYVAVTDIACRITRRLFQGRAARRAQERRVAEIRHYRVRPGAADVAGDP